MFPEVPSRTHPGLGNVEGQGTFRQQPQGDCSWGASSADSAILCWGKGPRLLVRLPASPSFLEDSLHSDFTSGH